MPLFTDDDEINNNNTTNNSNNNKPQEIDDLLTFPPNSTAEIDVDRKFESLAREEELPTAQKEPKEEEDDNDVQAAGEPVQIEEEKETVETEVITSPPKPLEPAEPVKLLEPLPWTLSSIHAEDNEIEDGYDTEVEDLPKEEVNFLEIEEKFFTKLNKKFIFGGYKRPLENIRWETRRKYQHFRAVQKNPREKNRKNEKFQYDYVPQIFSKDSTTGTTPSQPFRYNPAAATSSAAASTNPAVAATNTTNPASNPAPANSDSKYLSLNQEREYQEALRQSSAVMAPTTGLSLQQMLDMCNRDLTPEDYEMLLRLDEAVEKKTVKQETLTTLTEKTIDQESLLTEVCTVCMCNYEMGENIKYLPCNHFFHVDCIVPYLSSYGQSCPICKSKV